MEAWLRGTKLRRAAACSSSSFPKSLSLSVCQNAATSLLADADDRGGPSAARPRQCRRLRDEDSDDMAVALCAPAPSLLFLRRSSSAGLLDRAGLDAPDDESAHRLRILTAAASSTPSRRPGITTQEEEAPPLLRSKQRA